MTAANMAAILDRPADTFERPKPLPVGQYLTTVVGQPRQDVSEKKQTPFVEYTLKLMQAYDDVDQEALTEAGGIGDRTMKITFYLTEASAYRLKEFLEHCGVDIDGKKLSQAIGEAAGCQVVIKIKHTASDDGEQIYANIARTLPVE